MRCNCSCFGFNIGRIGADLLVDCGVGLALRSGLREGGHGRGKGNEEEAAGGERGVHDVLADAAEHLLDYRDGGNGAESGDEHVAVGREYEPEYDARDSGGKIAYRLTAFHYDAA